MSELKKCSKCLGEKSLDDFNKSRNKKNGVSSICKECHSEYRKKHYLLNKKKVLEQVKNYNDKYGKSLSNGSKIKYSHLKDVYRFNYKSGRFNEYTCCVCGDLLCATKKEVLNNVDIKCKKCKEMDKKTLFHYFTRVLQRRAKSKKLEYDLSEEFLKFLFEEQNGKCIISGIDLILNISGKTIDTASLDRIDSNKGYIKSNVMWVALPINYMKSNYKEIEIIKFITILRKN